MASLAATSFTARSKDQTGHTLRMRGAAQRTHTRGCTNIPPGSRGMGHTLRAGAHIPPGSRGMGHTLRAGAHGNREARPTFNKIQ